MPTFNNPPYLSTFVSAPNILVDIFAHIDREIDARSRSGYSHVQRRMVLLQGVATPPIFARFVDPVFPEHPDASGVERTTSGIKGYLGKLLSQDDTSVAAAGNSSGSTIIDPDKIDPKLAAPDASSIRLWLQEYLEIDDPEETAEGLATINPIAPLLVDALLEFRFPDARRLYDEAIRANRDSDEGETLFEYCDLITAMHKIAIAFVLRQVFMICAAHIHAPTGWDALDALQRDGSGGALRVRTLVERLEIELNRVQRAVDLYDSSQHSQLVIVQGHVAHSAANDNIPLLFERLGIVPRARVQLALWRAEHGDRFDGVLAAVIGEIKRWLVVFRRELRSFKKRHHANKVLGNLTGPSVQVQAYLAVREAVAWTTPIVDGQDRISPESLISLAVKARSGGAAQLATIKAQKVGANDEFADRLFQGLRVAFLQDDEALHPTLQVTDPRSTNGTKVRTHDRAAKIKGAHYSLETQLNALTDTWRNSAQKVPAVAAKWQIALANRLDFEIKRETQRWLRSSKTTYHKQLFAGRDMVRQRIMRDLKVA